MRRVKRRYLALQIDCEVALSPNEFRDAVWSAVAKLYGEYGASQTNLVLIDFDAEKKTAVVRTSLASVGLVRASLASVTSIAGRAIAVHVVAVSGTIKALYAKLNK